MVIYVCKVLPLMTNMDEYEGHDVLLQVIMCQTSNPEAEFFDEIQKKVCRVFLLAIHSHFYYLQLSLEIYIS
jgi:hypothetical protein